MDNHSINTQVWFPPKTIDIKFKLSDWVVNKYRDRLAILEKLGEEDEECNGLNAESKKDFLTFIVLNNNWTKANLALLDSGHLSATWRKSNDRHLVIQFLGGSRCRYVIINRKRNEQEVSYVSKTGTIADFKTHAREFDLQWVDQEHSVMGTNYYRATGLFDTLKELTSLMTERWPQKHLCSNQMKMVSRLIASTVSQGPPQIKSEKSKRSFLSVVR